MNHPQRPTMTTTGTNMSLADNSATAVSQLPTTTNDHWHGQTRTRVEGHRMRTRVDEDKEPKTRHLTSLGPLVCFFISFHITITLLTTFSDVITTTKWQVNVYTKSGWLDNEPQGASFFLHIFLLMTYLLRLFRKPLRSPLYVYLWYCSTCTVPLNL